MLQHNSHGRVRKLLLCPPTYYSELNTSEMRHSLLDAGDGQSRRACSMYRGLVHALSEAGVDVFWERPHPDHPWQVYTRDFGVNTPAGVLIGKYRHPVRRGDEEFGMEALEALHAPVVGRVARGAFEGGDCWLLDESTLAVGAGSRSTVEGIANAGEILKPHGIDVIGVTFDASWRHLDMIFAVVAENLAMYAEDRLPPDFTQVLKDRGWRLIPLSQELVTQGGCNLLSLGDGRVLSFLENETVNEILVSEGLEVLIPPLGEFTKMGGGPRCLTFELEREA